VNESEVSGSASGHGEVSESDHGESESDHGESDHGERSDHENAIDHGGSHEAGDCRV
jgi:hypothetical protein